MFAPRHGGAEDGGAQGAENDGWLLSLVHDRGVGRSELVVLDPREMSEPQARVLLPQRVPWGFHSGWVAESTFRK